MGTEDITSNDKSIGISDFAAPDGKLQKMAIKPVNLVSIILILWNDLKAQAAHLGTTGIS